MEVARLAPDEDFTHAEEAWKTLDSSARTRIQVAVVRGQGLEAPNEAQMAVVVARKWKPWMTLAPLFSLVLLLVGLGALYLAYGRSRAVETASQAYVWGIWLVIGVLVPMVLTRNFGKAIHANRLHEEEPP